MKGLKLLNSCRLAIVDDEDYDRCLKVKWKLVLSNGHVAGHYHREPITLERFVMWYFDDDPRNVSHVDGDKFDCRKENLQPAPKAGNLAAPRPVKIIRQRTESAYRGVSWSYAMKQWEARIDLPDGNKHICYSPSEEHAAAQYDLAMMQNFRKVDPATLNFPVTDYGLTREHLL